MDLMLITATEDIDENQIFFENVRERYQVNNRFREEYEMDTWDIYRKVEGDTNAQNNTSDRCRALRRISEALEETSPN